MNRSHPTRPRPCTRTAGAGIVVTLLVALLVAVLGASGTGAGAQARPVTALVHTFPDRPEPGDDVVVRVDVAGCPPGPVTVELYLATEDGASRYSTLMGRAAASTNLLSRTHAVVALPRALRGWYGARVLCGSFRPAREPMTNTLFAVGPTPPPPATLSGGTVVRGETLRFAGAGCAGTLVEYDLTSGHRTPGAFEVEGRVAVGPDGAWSTDVLFPLDLPAGPVTVRARCVGANLLGEPAYVYEPRSIVVRVT